LVAHLPQRKMGPKLNDAIPVGGEDAFNRATQAARDAVAAMLQPMIADAEKALERATEERDRFASGR
jgi:hypothetical protein